MAKLGTLYGIGLGPGDSELITLKALKAIKACPVLFYPATEDGTSMVRNIAAPHIKHAPKEYPIKIPMTPEFAPAERAYDESALLISEYLNQGINVAILCEGDPFFYGSFIYLFNRLNKTNTIEVIPGVSSIMACASAIPMPLVARNEYLAIIPATLNEARIKSLLNDCDAAAIIKLGRHFKKVKGILTELSLIDRCYYVERATLDNQQIHPLCETSDTAPYFSMILFQQQGTAWRR